MESYQSIEKILAHNDDDLELHEEPIHRGNDNVCKYIWKKLSSMDFWKTMMSSMLFRLICASILLSVLIFNSHVNNKLNTLIGGFDEVNELLLIAIRNVNDVEHKFEVMDEKYKSILSLDLEKRYKLLEDKAQAISDKLSSIDPSSKKITIPSFTRNLVETDFFWTNGHVTTTAALHVDCPSNTLRVGCGSNCQRLNQNTYYASNSYPENESTCVGICLMDATWVNTSPLTVWAICMQK